LGSGGFFAIDEANKETCARQFRAKVDGTIVLAQVLRDAELDFVLLLSSISSLLAGLGYVAYSAANNFLDAAAARLSLEGNVPWISINLDSWIDEPEFWEPDPFELVMNSEEGLEVVRRILARKSCPTVAVSTGDLDHRMDQWINPASLRSAKDRRDLGNERLHPRPDLATEYVAPSGAVEIEIATAIQEMLGVAAVGAEDDFFGDLGGTSLLATQLVARLRQIFPVELPLRRFYEQPTVAKLGQAILAEQGEHVE
jgi:acyl carrier protein